MEDMEKIGNWAFIVGVLLAIIAGFVAIPQITLILVVLGVIVGLLNVSAKETEGFLLAAIALGIAGSANLSSIPGVGPALTALLGNVRVLVAPAIVIVALKALYDTASSK